MNLHFILWNCVIDEEIFFCDFLFVTVSIVVVGSQSTCV